jgi:hypothetical protein
MRFKIAALSLAVITAWSAVPEDADAFGHHRKRGRHHRGQANVCCPSPCETAVAYQPTYAQPTYVQPSAPVAGACCGGSTVSYGAHQGDMYGQPQGQYMMQGGQYDANQGYGNQQTFQSPNQSYGQNGQGGQNFQGGQNAQPGLNQQDVGTSGQLQRGTGDQSGNVTTGGTTPDGIGVGKADMAPDGGR